MRRVRLFNLMAGPDGVWQPGDHDMTEGQAAGLVAAGVAEYLDRAPKAAPMEPATTTAPEVAAVAASERADLPRRAPTVKQPAKGK